MGGTGRASCSCCSQASSSSWASASGRGSVARPIHLPSTSHEPSLDRYGAQGETLVPPRTRRSVSHSLTRTMLNRIDEPSSRVCMRIHPECESCGHVRSRFECLFSMALLTGRCGARNPCASKGSSSGCSRPPPSVRRGWPPRQNARRAVSIQGSLYPENTD